MSAEKPVCEPFIAADESETNPTDNPWLNDIIEQRYGRRQLLQGGAAVTASLLTGQALAHGNDRGRHHAKHDRKPGHKPDHKPDHAHAHQRPRLTPAFDAVPAFNPGLEDQVVVPEGYRVQVLIPEGTPITGHYPSYIPGDHNSGAEREQQTGGHHDGMHFFPLQRGKAGNEAGVLCVNHENLDLPFIHPHGYSRGADGSRPVEDEVRKEVASHGVSVVQIAKQRSGQWQVVRSRLNRRITAGTPMEITGPARGSHLMRTKYSPKGTRTRGTLNNCANGFTPWGTYLTCEENWAGYFFNTQMAERPREHARYGVPSNPASTLGWGTRAEDRYARFNATPTTASYYDPEAAKTDYRNEPNTFGWVVEIDPFNPKSTPKKRTALGRLGHEGAWVAPAVPGKPIVVYTGDDARGEYMYKYVSREPYWPWDTDCDNYLDDGTWYVARFNPDGSGVWIALAAGKNGLTPRNGFANQAEILINTRSAADHVKATKLDRPEWAAIDERNGDIYLTLTNNSARGSAAQPVDPANPRAGNPDGHIIRWREARGNYAATEFRWDMFAFGGPTRETIATLGAVAPYHGDPSYAAQLFPGTARQKYLGEEGSFNSPDGLWVDAETGLVWIQTDGYSNTARGFGNQQMLVVNPDNGVLKRFLVGPRGCEITGITATPDRRTLFVNIQHPTGTWPNINGETRPRSATVVITREGDGYIGT